MQSRITLAPVIPSKFLKIRDAFFALDKAKWVESSRQGHSAAGYDTADFSFVTFRPQGRISVSARDSSDRTR